MPFVQTRRVVQTHDPSPEMPIAPGLGAIESPVLKRRSGYFPIVSWKFVMGPLY